MYVDSCTHMLDPSSKVTHFLLVLYSNSTFYKSNINTMDITLQQYKRAIQIGNLNHERYTCQ